MSARYCFLAIVPLVLLLLGAGDSPDNRRRLAEQEALGPLQDLVGQWRGVGQPQRGANRGAWIEESDWAWRFEGDGATLAFAAPESKALVSGELSPGKNPGEFVLQAKAANGETVEYAGRRDDGGALVLLARAVPQGAPARVTLRFAAGGKRLVVLHERRVGEADRFVRMAEVGYTRQGSGFGQGATQIECVVTGGLGTIPVTHNGKTYYVCCTGCRDLFHDDPEGILAEYEERKAQEREEKR